MALLALLPVLVLLGALLSLPALNLLRSDFRSNWLLSTAATLIALLVLLYLRVRLPLSFTLHNWIIDTGTRGVGALWQFDAISLSFAVALLTGALAAIVSDVQRAVTEFWTYWLAPLGIALTALLAVMAGNPLALALSWILLDGLLLGWGLLWLRDRSSRAFVLQRLVLSVLSAVLLLGGALADGGASEASFAPAGPTALLLFILAAGIRLGVLPLNPYAAAPLEVPASRWVQLRILPAAASLALLARLDTGGLSPGGWLLFLAWFGGLYAATKSLQSQNPLAALSYWLAGLSSLALGAALLGAPLAVQAIGLSGLLLGALLALGVGRVRARWPLVIFGVLGLGAFPFTPAFAFGQLYAEPIQWVALIFLLLHSALLFVWLRHAWFVGRIDESLEPWARTIYMGGLLVLPAVQILLALGLAPDLAPRNLPPFPFWPTVALWVLAAAILVLDRRASLLPMRLKAPFQAFFSLRWLYASFGRLLTAVESLFGFLGRLLEGRAGVLWALLTVLLLLSLIIQLAVAV